jgi:hypothetical protein
MFLEVSKMSDYSIWNAPDPIKEASASYVRLLLEGAKAFHTAHFKYLTGWSFEPPQQYKSVTLGDPVCAIRFTPIVVSR